MTMTNTSSEYFRQVAGQWDDISAGYFGEAVRQAAIAKAYLRPEMAVADVGAGTGFIAAGLAPLVKRVYVVDGSPEMLAVARQNLSAFSNIEFHEADGVALPFPEDSLDAVFANMYLHHAPDPLAALQEMLRVLRPGGRLVITDMDSHAHTWLKEEMADVWQGFERDQVRAWLREAGLVNVIVDSTGQSCCAESGGTCNCAENGGVCSRAENGGSCSCARAAGDGQKAEISVFVATGTRRMAMRSAVQDSYSARATGSSGCCSSNAEMSAVIEQLSASAGETVGSGACCSSGADAGASQSAGCGCGSSDSACCASVSPGEASFSSTYSAEELSAAPREAAEISLGCGNPLALANLKPGEVVLDIGSGGGLDSFLAAGKVGSTGRVIGVDMTPAMLERARAAAERSAIVNVEFRQGYAEELPVEDGSVDVILSNCVINLTEDKGLVFREAFRALKPGGRLEVSDVVTSGPVPLDLRENAIGWSECITGALPESEYRDLVAQAGFQAITTRHSPSLGEALGISVYSVILSAVKPS